MASGRAVLKDVLEERELLQSLLEKEGLSIPGFQTAWVTPKQAPHSSQEAPSIRPSLFPLSYPQEQLWFLDRLQPGNPFNNVSFAWRLKGDLDIPRLERSLEEIVRRHEILRTCFVIGEDEQPRQQVAGERFDVRLQIVDLQEVAASQREKQAKRVLEEEGGKGFDLGQMPLLRGVLVRMAERDHIFEMTLHHIICDEWSLRILMEELATLYEAYGKGQESPLLELQMQYGDYALEQRELMRGEQYEQHVEYWKGQLEGMPRVLNLPKDRKRPARQSFHGGREQRTLRGDLFEGLNAVARREKASLFMLLLAAYQVLLMRYSGQEDFGVGTVVANRKRKETEGLIGSFLNTLVMRANLKGEPTFREVLRQAQEAALGGYEHQDLPFEKLVEELAPNRDASGIPMLQAMFTLRGLRDNVELSGLELDAFDVDLNTSKFDLDMVVDETRHGTAVGFNYSTDLFDAETIQRMLEHYECLLVGIVANTGQSIWVLPMMGELDEKILSGWNHTSQAYSSQKNILEILDSQAERQPRAPAAIFGRTRLTIAGLSSKASQIGHHLVQMGVKPETLVGIFMTESAEMVTAILGVLKAGAAYVLLDVLNPRDRLRCIIDGSGIAMLLTLEGLRKRLPQTNAPVMCLDSEWELVARQSATSPQVQIHPENLACVIYTSALEGHTKGLMIQHNELINLVCASESSDRASQHGRVAESSRAEIWSRLRRSGYLMATSAFVTLAANEQRTLARPGGNVEIYILDPHLQRVPIGVPGEIWMAAPGIGRGYVGWPLLTAEKFLPNPYASQTGTRMWGSGQRARYTRDGTIELLGELDDRIEIGGCPVELGEIESTLANHESVRQAVVVVRANSELVAYVVACAGEKLSQSELTGYLDTKLPLYMIPTAFISLQALPCNSKGEVDRAALAALGEDQLTKEFLLPRTELEQMIADAWKAVLSLDQVGIHDNFFERGGNSLLLIQLHQKLRALLPFDIELLHLFQFPSIYSLARFIQTGYNFDGKFRDTRERAGRQKSAVQKLRRGHTPWTERHLTE
jgi:non-ribosomal peptide synthetase component F